MTADFRDAAERHHSDGLHLLGDGRAAGADQQFGVAAECALKAILVGLKAMPLGASGSPSQRDHRVHADGIWALFATCAQGRKGVGYARLLQVPVNPFADWKIEQRYQNRGAVTADAVRRHEYAAGLAMRAMAAAVLNGDVQ